MSTDRFARLRQILLQARGLSPRERTDFLDRSCGDDAELRSEVEELLGHDDSDDSLLATGAPVARAESDLIGWVGGEVPVSIGPYIIVEELGRGGMGVVYRARQERPIQRQVALKLIKRGMDTDRVVARFQAERQALALMDHPNIARVLDAGADESGRPFFVMELVEGEPITGFCDRERLSTDDRLSLLLEVCRGVQHAHQKGIVHRDLKPSNILVRRQDGEAAVKIIDFGIAKLVADDDAERSMMTVEGQMIGTPEYMSPEQASGKGAAIDTRTDVYSLGVLLYELLTGHRPYRFDGRSQHEIARVFEQAEPEKPSTVITRQADDEAPSSTEDTGAARIAAARGSTVSRLRRELSGDLDNIALMAMRKEPDQRYASVDALADDLRRQRMSLPVRARNDSWSYRSSRFVRRHALSVGLTTVAFVVLLGFAISVSIQSTRVAKERDRAIAAEDRATEAARRATIEAETAREVSEFMVGLFEVSDPSESKGNTITAREILDRGSERIQEELSDQPEVRATMMDAMGRVYQSLALYEQSEALLGGALDQRREIYGDENALVGQSLVRKGFLLRDLGRYDEAKVLVEEGLAIQIAELDEDHEDVVEAQYQLATLAQRLGDLDTAERMFRDVLAADLRVLGEDDPYIPSDMNNLASVLHDQGRFEEAHELYERALDLHIGHHGEDHPEVATTLANWSNVYLSQGDLERAVELNQRALDIRLRVLGEDHPHTAIAMGNLGTKLQTQGHLVEAEELLVRSLEIRRERQGARHPSTAHNLILLASVQAAKGELEDAEASLRESLSIYREALPKGHNSIARSLHGLGRVLMLEGRSGEAEAVLEEALAIRRAKFPDGHRELSDSLERLAESRAEMGRFDEAEALLLESYASLGNKRGESNRRVRKTAAKLSDHYAARGDSVQTRFYRQRSLAPRVGAAEG